MSNRRRTYSEKISGVSKYAGKYFHYYSANFSTYMGIGDSLENITYYMDSSGETISGRCVQFGDYIFIGRFKFSLDSIANGNPTIEYVEPPGSSWSNFSYLSGVDNEVLVTSYHRGAEFISTDGSSWSSLDVGNGSELITDITKVGDSYVWIDTNADVYKSDSVDLSNVSMFNNGPSTGDDGMLYSTSEGLFACDVFTDGRRLYSTSLDSYPIKSSDYSISDRLSPGMGQVLELSNGTFVSFMYGSTEISSDGVKVCNINISDSLNTMDLTSLFTSGIDGHKSTSGFSYLYPYFFIMYGYKNNSSGNTGKLRLYKFTNGITSYSLIKEVDTGQKYYCNSGAVKLIS